MKRTPLRGVRGLKSLRKIIWRIFGLLKKYQNSLKNVGKHFLPRSSMEILAEDCSVGSGEDRLPVSKRVHLSTQIYLQRFGALVFFIWIPNFGSSSGSCKLESSPSTRKAFSPNSVRTAGRSSTTQLFDFLISVLY